jgi:TonB family protein
MSCPDPYRPYDPSETPASAQADLKVDSHLPTEADVRGLTRTLAASGGGDLSQDLALDLILNQIVEQACLATGATGAAIALTRDGEMVCRATTGRNAPDLGVRLDNAGFSSECLRIGTLQRCDDTETDPRVDATACRLLGVRSILVVPLWYWGEFMGIFEIFSPRSNAFGERDEQTLQALAYRIVRHAKQATGTITGFTANPEKVAVLTPKAPEPKPQPEIRREPVPTPVFELTPAPPAPREPRDVWTIALASVAVLIAAAIVTLMVWRVGWASTDAKPAVAPPRVVQANSPPASAMPANVPPPAPQEEILTLDPSALQPKASTPSPQPAEPAKKKEASASANSSAALGGLAIYDKDKLVYGRPIPDADDSLTVKPQTAKPATPRTLQAKATTPLPAAADSFSTRPVQLKPEVADNLLTTRVEPEYPDAARRAHVQGMVTLDTLIGVDGKVQQANPVNGNAQLAEAAVTAVRQWRYKPYVLKGKPVPVRTQVNVQFMLAR